MTNEAHPGLPMCVHTDGTEHPATRTADGLWTSCRDEVPSMAALAESCAEAAALLDGVLDTMDELRRELATESARELVDWLNDRVALAWAGALTARSALRLLAAARG